MSDTEVVKIRITTSAKHVLDAVATAEYRTFQDQVRLILDKWCEGITVKTLNTDIRNKEETEVVKMRISFNAKQIIDKMSIKAGRSFQEQVRVILSNWAAKQRIPSFNDKVQVQVIPPNVSIE